MDHTGLVKFHQHGSRNGEKENAGKAQKLSSCKDAQQGSGRGKPHLQADHLGLQRLADDSDQQVEAEQAEAQAFGTADPGCQGPGK